MAERIRALEAKTSSSLLRKFRPTKSTKNVSQSKARTFERPSPGAPGNNLIAPLRTRRSVFKATELSPHRPETPIHRSIPEDDPYIHSPQPERSLPKIVEPLEQAQHTLDTSRGNDDGFAISSGFGRRVAKNFAVRRTSRPHEDVGSPSLTHHRYRYQLGSITNCTRHGRRPPGTPHDTGATKDMIDRARSGEYIPIGMLHRSQLESTSPWAYLERAKVPIEDVCPDCAAEERLMMMDAMQAQSTPLHPPHSLTEPDTGVVTATNLPKAIGTIIIFQGGVLHRVITNVHQGNPTAPDMRKLLEKLARVSQDLASIGRPSQATASPEQALKTMIFDTQAVKPQPSIPELLDLTDRIANEMQLDIGQRKLAPPANKRAREQSLLHSEDADSLMSNPSPTLVEPAPFCVRATPGPPSVYVTAVQSRKTSVIHVPAPIKPDSKCSTLPSAMPRTSDAWPIPVPKPLEVVPREVKASERRSTAQSDATLPSRLSPKSVPYPMIITPELRDSPRSQKRVRAMDLWPSKLRAPDGRSPSSAKVAEQAQLASHNARLDMNKAVQDAAEIERQMRRKVRTRGGLGGTSKAEV